MSEIKFDTQSDVLSFCVTEITLSELFERDSRRYNRPFTEEQEVSMSETGTNEI